MFKIPLQPHSLFCGRGYWGDSDVTALPLPPWQGCTLATLLTDLASDQVVATHPLLPLSGSFQEDPLRGRRGQDNLIAGWACLRAKQTRPAKHSIGQQPPSLPLPGFLDHQSTVPPLSNSISLSRRRPWLMTVNAAERSKRINKEWCFECHADVCQVSTFLRIFS